MAAYFILTHTITDIERYRDEYIPQVFPFIAKYDGEVIAASFDAEPLQGNPEIRRCGHSISLGTGCTGLCK
jgi:uncharacterized protein (DUF1330 family)